MINEFNFICRPTVIYGKNAISYLPAILKKLNTKKLLLVVDKNFSDTELFSGIINNLKKEKIDFIIFDKILGEPTVEIGDECGEIGRKNKCDTVCGIGGGSTLDTAKAASILITNSGSVKDYQGLNKVQKPGVPKVMIPTTAGTGSEVTFTAVFIRKDIKRKGGINSPYLYPEFAILDPVLTLTLPPSITASTGLDALCHAIESYISRKSNFLTESISLKAIKMIWDNIEEVYINGENLNARENMLYASFLAGLSLANAGVTAVHAISYPLGGRFMIPHGIANAIILPYVLEYDLKYDVSYTVKNEFATILDYIQPDYRDKSEEIKADLFIEKIRELNKKLNIPRLRDLNIPRENFDEMANEALQVSVPIENNPYPIKKEHIIEIYNLAY